MASGSGTDGEPFMSVRGPSPRGPFVAADFVLYAVAGLFALTGVLAVESLESGLPLSTFLFEVFMNVGLAVVVIAGGISLRYTDLPRATWWSVVTGYIAGVMFIGILVVWAYLPELLAGESLVTLRDDFIFFGNLGGLFGFMGGVSRARSEYNRQLRQNLEARNELVESTQEALWMFTADWSELLYLNSAYETLFGQSTAALEENPTVFLDAVHVGDRDRVRDAMERLSRGESIELEIRVNPGEGFQRWIWTKGQPVYRDGDLYAFAGFARDITERKQRERHFEAVFNGTYQFTGLMEPDGTLVEVNETALEFVGADRQAVTDIPLWETPWFQYDDETREMARESVEKASNGDFYRNELPIEGANGETILVDYSVRPVTDENGEVSLLVPEGRDISHRKEYEEQVVSLHETTRRLFRVETTEEAAQIAVDTARDVLGLPVSTVLYHEDNPKALVPLASTSEAVELLGSIPTVEAGNGLAWDVFESGDPLICGDVHSMEGRYNLDTVVRSELILPLGEFGVLMVGSTVVDDFDDRQVSLVKLLATNTEAALDRLEQRQDLEERQAELERQNERLEEFASVVSHDLRNPLSVAKGNLSFVREECDTDDVDRVSDALERMEELIDDLLKLARAGNTIEELTAVSLSDTARLSWMNVDTASAELEVTAETKILADESRLSQLLENLFRNAVEHGGEDVSITVGALSDGFYVEDDGPGVSDPDHEEIFETGYSTAPSGAGFGLSIVQNIATAHDWEVSVVEGEDGGARFEITGVQAVETASNS